MDRLWTLAGPTELADQRLIHVELRGYGTAAVEVKVVLAAQLALLAQGRLAGRALLLKITEVCESTEEVKSKKYYHRAWKKLNTIWIHRYSAKKKVFKKHPSIFLPVG